MRFSALIAFISLAPSTFINAAPRSAVSVGLPKTDDSKYQRAIAMCTNPRPKGVSGPCNCWTLSRYLADCTSTKNGNIPCSSAGLKKMQALYDCHKCKPNSFDPYYPADDILYLQKQCQLK